LDAGYQPIIGSVQAIAFEIIEKLSLLIIRPGKQITESLEFASSSLHL